MPSRDELRRAGLTAREYEAFEVVLRVLYRRRQEVDDALNTVRCRALLSLGEDELDKLVAAIDPAPRELPWVDVAR